MSIPRDCPKCRATDINVQWHRGRGYGLHRCGWRSATETDGEHLHFTCRDCGYDWTGAVAAGSGLGAAGEKP